MPINPPAFNVSPISPSILNENRRQSPIQQLFNTLASQAVQGRIQGQLAEEAAKRRKELELELAGVREGAQSRRDFTEDLRAGRISPVDQFDAELLEGLETFAAPEGSGVEGRFVTTRQAQLRQPVEAPPGEEWGPVTPTRADLTDLSGQPIRGEEKNYMVGSADALREAVQAGTEDPGVRRALEALITSAEESGGFFSAAEEEELREYVSPAALVNYADLSRAENQMDSEVRAAVNRKMRELATRAVKDVGARDETGIPVFERLTRQERWLVAMSETPGAVDMLSEEQIATVQNMDIITKVEPIDFRPEWRDLFTGASNANSPVFAEFVNWLRPKAEGNEKLMSQIREGARSGASGIALFQAFADNQVASAPFRAAFALHETGHTTGPALRDVVTRNGRAALPFSYELAVKGLKSIYPDFEESRLPPRSGSRPTGQTQSQQSDNYVEIQERMDNFQSVIQGAMDNIDESGSPSDFAAQRAQITNDINTIAGESAPLILHGLQSAVQGQSPQQAADSLNVLADRFEAEGVDTLMVQMYRSIAETALENPEQWETVRDSILLQLAPPSQPERPRYR